MTCNALTVFMQIYIIFSQNRQKYELASRVQNLVIFYEKDL